MYYSPIAAQRRVLVLRTIICLMACGVSHRALATAPPEMTLKQAIAVAVAQSDDLAAVRAALARAEAVRRRAISSLVPNITGQASYTLNDEEVRGGQESLFPVIMHLGLLESR